MARNPPGGHNKVSHSQFCQFGSRKSRDDSNLLDSSGSISLIARDSAQALRDWAGWIPFAAMRWICIEWSLNGSKTQMTYESYDINRTSGSDTDQLVWPLHKSSAFCVGHGCRMLRVEHCRMNETWRKTFLWKSTLNLQVVTPSKYGGGQNFKIDLTLIMCTWTKITWVTWGNEVQSCSQWCSKMVESG